MPRVKRIRKVLSAPIVAGFKPYGPDLSLDNGDRVFLFFEEYEALRLCDYDGYNHHQASEVMQVSRPTYTRIYASARRKLALAFVEGRQISIEGGKVFFDSGWYNCNSCQCHFNCTEINQKVENCPLCGSTQVKLVEVSLDKKIDIRHPLSNASLHVCKHCGYQHCYDKGDLNFVLTCPQCKSKM